MELIERDIHCIYLIMIREMIANLETQREEFGHTSELRGNYNDVLDRLRVLESKLCEMHKADHLREGNYGKQI